MILNIVVVGGQSSKRKLAEQPINTRPQKQPQKKFELGLNFLVWAVQRVLDVATGKNYISVKIFKVELCALLSSKIPG